MTSAIEKIVGDMSRLVSGHVDHARLELEVRTEASLRRLALLAVAGSVLLLGYGLAVVGVALHVGARVGVARAFVGIGGAHVFVGAGLVAVAAFRPWPSPVAAWTQLRETVRRVAAALVRSTDPGTEVARGDGTPLRARP